MTRNSKNKLPFIPKELPLENIPWEKLIGLIVGANSAVARYDGRLEGILNPKVFLSPLMTQEAVLSSKIEGTQATLEEVLEFEADPSEHTEKYEDIEEIINYRKASYFAEDYLQKRPVCLNMVKDIHGILLEGVRGQNKGKGEFRKKQNWIGKPNSKMEEATYVPPPPNKIYDLLSNWEKYCHFNEKDNLIQLAIIHAQFELIHPFLDGNGRIGRILIPLLLYEKKILSSPTFYMSAYLEATRDEYYARLLAVSESSDWEGWIKYFLNAIIEQSKKNSEKAKKIMTLYDDMKEIIPSLTHSRFSIQALDFLFSRPVFRSSAFSLATTIPKTSVIRILNCLEKGHIINKIRKSRGRRSALYVFTKLFEIVKT